MAEPASTTLLARARAWDQRSLSPLGDLTSDMSDIFDGTLSRPSSSRQDSARELRAAVDYLLDYTRPPKAYRIMFLVFRSVTMENHKAARKVLAQAVREMGILKGDVWRTVGRDEMVEQVESWLEEMKGVIDESWGLADGKKGKAATSASSSGREFALAGIEEKQDGIEEEPIEKSGADAGEIEGDVAPFSPQRGQS